jgi:hypothetical protein
VAHLRYNLEVIAHLVQCLAKAHIIMHCIHLNEAKKCLLDGPCPREVFFDPVPSIGKISIGVAGLQRITR